MKVTPEDPGSERPQRPIPRSRRIAERAVPAAVLIVVFLLAAPGGHYFFDVHFVASTAAEMSVALRNGDAATFYSLLRYPEDVAAGRVWPLMRPYFLGLYSLFGQNMLGWQWWTCAMLVLTSQAVYSLTARITNGLFAPLLATLLYLAYFPLALSVHALIMLETVIAPIACLAFVCLSAMESAASNAPTRRYRIWIPALTATGLLAATIGLKETSLAFVPAAGLIAIRNAIHGPKPVRMPALTVIAVLVVACAALAHTILTQSLRHGWYTKSYDMSNRLQALANIEWWRESLLTVYGPLLVLWTAALAVRLGSAIVRREWTADLTWRLALAAVPLGMVAVISPKAGQAHHYFNSSVAFLAIGIAWETTDFWARLKLAGRAANPPRPPSWTLAWVLVFGAIAAWCLPLVNRPIESPFWFGLKIAACVLTAITLFIFARRESRYRRAADGSGPTARRLGAVLLIVSSLHLTIFALPNVVLLPILERNRYMAMERPLDYLVEHVPPGGRIVAIRYASGRQGVQQLATHLAACKGRSDLEIVALPPIGAEANPKDYLFAPGLRFDAPLDLPNRRRLDFTTAALVYKPDLLQPARLSARLVGTDTLMPVTDQRAATFARTQRRPSLFYPYFVDDCALCWHHMTRSVYLPESPQ